MVNNAEKSTVPPETVKGLLFIVFGGTVKLS